MEQNNCIHLYSGVIYITGLFIWPLIGQVWIMFSVNTSLQTSSNVE